MGQPQEPYHGPDEVTVIAKIAPDIIEYVQWYAQHGYFLPVEYAKDPATWTQILRDIEAAMNLIINERVPRSEAECKLLYDGLEKYYTYARYLFRP